MEIYPMTTDQKGLYPLIQESVNARVAYNETLIIAFEGELNVQRLSRAIQKLTDRHDALRTVFNKDGITQSALDMLLIDLKITNINDVVESKKGVLFQHWLNQCANVVLNLNNGPLYQFYLITLCERFSVFAITAVNSLSDGISFAILAQELSQFYNEPLQDLAPPLPFSIFTQTQNDLIAKNPQQALYWEKLLLEKSIPRIDFPCSKTRPPVMSFKGSHRQFLIAPATTYQLRQFAKSNNLTIFITLLGVFSLAIHKLAQQNDIMIGVPFAYRQKQEAASCMGFCITIFPIRSVLKSTDTLNVYFKQVRKQVFSMFENCYVDINAILAKTTIQCDKSRPFFYDVLFNLERPQTEISFDNLITQITGLNSPYENIKFKADYFLPFNLTSGHAQFDLTGNIIENKNSCSAAFEYNTDIFNNNDIDSIINTFQTFLQFADICHLNRRLVDILG